MDDQAFVLEAEVKKLHRVVQREVGEDVDVADLVAKDSDWRGRAQRIVMLQEKLKQHQNTAEVRAAVEQNSQIPEMFMSFLLCFIAIQQTIQNVKPHIAP